MRPYLHEQRLSYWQEKITQYLEAFCEKNSISLKHVRSNRRDSNLVEERVMCAKYLRSLGYSFPKIGWALNRHHASILYHCNDGYKQRAKERRIQKIIDDAKNP